MICSKDLTIQLLILYFNKDLMKHQIFFLAQTSIYLHHQLHFLEIILALVLNHQPSSFNRSRSNQGVGNNFLGSEAATLTREKEKQKADAQVAIDDTLYELPDNLDLELGDSLVETLGTTVEDLFKVDNITKEKEDDVILKKAKDEYNFDDYFR